MAELPRNLLDEVETALTETRERLDALERLESLCRSLSFELGRGVDVFDLLDAATDEGERAARHTLVRVLRTAGR